MSSQLQQDNGITGQGSAIEQALVQGDMSALTVPQRIVFYRQVCESLGLNPLTKPFDYIKLNGKLTLYAKKDCTEQLRRIHEISLSIISREQHDGVYEVTARAAMKSGRIDEDTGCVTVKGLQGDNLANAHMKAVTKAKRRVTLSICGLGFLDESEIATVPSAEPSSDVPQISHGAIDSPRPQASPAPVAPYVTGERAKAMQDLMSRKAIAWAEKGPGDRATVCYQRKWDKNRMIEDLSREEYETLWADLLNEPDKAK